MKTTFKRKAFTLIELLIVIAIIGILFIVLVSKVDFATDKAKATGVQTDFRSFQVALETVARENAGFNTFGYDTGDANGNRIRDSFDRGDTNQNGEVDDDETWIGRKFYTEDWTGVYTLVKPGTTVYDVEVLAELELAINKNLDPALHISIDDNGIITMANQATDPWGNEYHGRYLSNAANDNLDRGTIVMYSNGANGVNGSADGIQGGLVNITTPSNNIQGQDDYALAVMYTKVNGYGEIQSITKGFSNNQQFSDANHVLVTPVGEIPAVQVPDAPAGGVGGVMLPAVNPSGDLGDYSWSQIKALAQANLSTGEYSAKYGIELGDTKVSNGVTYVLVDLDGNSYDGFIFMYNSGTKSQMNNTSDSDGGYVHTEIIKPHVDSLYINLADSELKAAIKQVSVTCTSGKKSAEGINNNGDSLYITNTYMFLASIKEMGWTKNGPHIEDEGEPFDYFLQANAFSNFANKTNITDVWWLRTAVTTSTFLFFILSPGGATGNSMPDSSKLVVPVFVIG